MITLAASNVMGFVLGLGAIIAFSLLGAVVTERLSARKVAQSK